MKNLYILGACGSIGLQVLDIVKKNKNKFNVVAISVGHDLNLARRVIEETNPEVVCFRNLTDLGDFKDLNAVKLYGDNGLLEIAKMKKYDNEVLVNALVGSSGLLPTIKAIEAKKDIALANKETLVIGGDIVTKLVKENNVNLYPIDSEHSAILKCLKGEKEKEVKRLIITSSGGAFRDKKRSELEDVTVDEALDHPNWKMGKKITIDSATMMNKGFEVIEAHHLFNMPYDKIDTVMHKESIIHSMVEYNDGSIKAELAPPDMRGPISYALMYPEHKDYEGAYLDFSKLLTLHFKPLSDKRYPCLKYAYIAGKKGGLYPCALNAANEAAVKLFLDGKIKFLEIEEIIEREISKNYDTNEEVSVDKILSLDKKIKERVLKEYGGSL